MTVNVQDEREVVERKNSERDDLKLQNSGKNKKSNSMMDHDNKEVIDLIGRK